MKYYGSLTIDHTKSKEESTKQNNASEELKNALIAIGWNWVETSAYMITTQDADRILEGIILTAKQSADLGTLSALTFHVQSVNTETACKAPSSAKNHPNALTNVRNKPTPKAAVQMANDGGEGKPSA